MQQPTYQPVTIDYGSAFAQIWRHPQGKSALLVGSLLFLAFPLLFIPPLVALGWGIRYGRSVAAGEDQLPRWEFGLIIDGLKLIAVYVIYLLPVFVVLVPLVFIPLLGAGSDSEPPDFFALFALGPFLLVQLYGLALNALFPAVWAVLIAEDSVAACFSPRLIHNVVSAAGWNYLGVAAVVFGVDQAAGLGLIACLIGIFFTLFYATVIGFHFSGQLARTLMARAEWELPSIQTGPPSYTPPLPPPSTPGY